MELEKMSKYARKKALQAQQAAEDAKAERKASALAAAFEAWKEAASALIVRFAEAGRMITGRARAWS